MELHEEIGDDLNSILKQRESSLAEDQSQRSPTLFEIRGGYANNSLHEHQKYI
jgi:hypothetical protein